MDDTCIFCKIASGSMGTAFVLETDNVVAFDDIAPIAPVHVLVVSKAHVPGLRDLDDAALAAELLTAVRTVAEKRGLLDTGYRVITNDGSGAGQTVFHLHFHVIGGGKLPPMG